MTKLTKRTEVLKHFQKSMAETTYKDYPAKLIKAKLKQVDEFEANYGKSLRTKAIRKWCESAEYRKNEWQWRQNVAEYALHNAHKAFMAG